MNPKLFFTLAVFIAVFGILPESFAGNHLLFSLTSKNIARIGVINEGKNSVSVQISDMAGVNVFSETVKGGENFFKLLDLSNLPDGKYKVLMSGNNLETERNFTISNGKAALLKTVKEVPPKFYEVNKESLVIYYPNVQNSNVKVTFEMNDRIVFEDKVTGSPVKRTYSLKELSKGTYLVFLNTGKEVYSYSLTLP